MVGGRLERPGRNLRVVLYRHGNRDGVLAEAETGAGGEWCVGLPADLSFGVDVIAEAEYRGEALRRSVIAEFGQTISVRSEALHRILEDRERPLSDRSRAAYLNMQAVASTAVDLLAPVRPRQEESPGTLVERMKRRLLQDHRLGRRFDGGDSEDAAN